MHGCATAQKRKHATWITRDIRDAYLELHQQGFAHSIEVYCDGQLAGGTYGVSLGGLFAAESMFYLVRDAAVGSD
jgi:leucyl/phenylalanyl-tRNA--protein transferase